MLTWQERDKNIMLERLDFLAVLHLLASITGAGYKFAGQLLLANIF